MNVVKNWDIDVNLEQYNLYLMPLAYISDKEIIEPVRLTDGEEKFIEYAKDMLSKKESADDGQYDVAIQIELDFKKGNTFGAIGVKYDPDGISIALTEEDMRKKYPWDYRDLVNECRKRYLDFNENVEFHNIKENEVKKDDKLFHVRVLDPGNSKSPKKGFYSTNSLKVFDKYYNKK